MLFHLSLKLTLELAANDLSNVAQLEAKCMRGVAEIELNGLKIDMQKFQLQKQNVDARYQQDAEILKEKLGWTTEEHRSKNVNSTQQVGWKMKSVVLNDNLASHFLLL